MKEQTRADVIIRADFVAWNWWRRCGRGMGLMQGARLIGLDWGTSSLRAYLFGDNGMALAERMAPSGVMHLQRFLPPGKTEAPREQLIEAAFDEICAEWLAEKGRNLQVIACGMVGSTVGWKEAAYLKVPVGTGALAKALTMVKTADGVTVQIVPGICAAGVPGKSFPEILRGEETQIAGIIARLAVPESGASENLLIGLPGTHSKWVQVRDREIVSFSTFVTGELYGLLTRYSVVAKSEKKPELLDAESFHLGLQLGRARTGEAAGGLLSTIFSTRSKRVLSELREEQQPDYLSGLLIGEELASVQRVLARDQRSLSDYSRILLAGDRALCARYQAACRQLSWPAPDFVEGATELGLWSIAWAAGLVN